MVEKKPESPQKDHLRMQIRDLPFFRGLLRAVEASYYDDIQLDEPVLDVGCGDGHFASLAIDQPIAVGLDPWGGPIREAAQYPVYQCLVQADAAFSPFQPEQFGSAISNSVLEHIEHIDKVLEDVQRVLKPGAKFYFCVPNNRAFSELSIYKFFKAIRLNSLANAYDRFFRFISRTQHANTAEVWETHLNKAGFELVDHWRYFPPKALRWLEWGHYLGLPSWLIHFVTGRWNLVRDTWNFRIIESLLRKHADPTPTEDGTYTFFVARKKTIYPC